MNEQIKDGGQAFPISGYEGESTMSGPVKGMTLRDYFAAKAMQGFCADPTNHKVFDDMDDMARNAYHVADAMLAAREVTP